MTLKGTKPEVHQELDHLFRRQSGKLVASLTRAFGPENLSLVENVVQEALIKAMQTWPTQGVPEKPAAWITQVAKNLALDTLKRDKILVVDSKKIEKMVERLSEETPQVTLLRDELRDDPLRLIFICCHPVLSREVRISLTLKTVCGFSIGEIGRAFLTSEETISQRIVRAKNKIRDIGLRYEVPAPQELPERIDSVLDVIYLLFNEGYSAHEGNDLIRKEFAEEAIRLCRVLVAHTTGKTPKAYALLSLMLLQSSRFAARLDENGDIQLLEDQNRELWDHERIRDGLNALELSAEGDSLSEYHLQAGIASCHAVAGSYEETDWPQILNYYQLLEALNSNPVISLNLIVALAMVEGPEAGIRELEKIAQDPAFKSYYLFPATLAEFYRRVEEFDKATTLYRKALELVGTEPERKFLEKRILKCQQHEIH